MAFYGVASSIEYKKRLPNHLLVPELGFFQEEFWDALGFDFLIVFVEPFSRPRLACGFDFLGKVFTEQVMSLNAATTPVS